MVGKAIKFLRKNKNYRQEDLRKLINVSRSTLCDYETERIHISYEMMEEIAKACGYTIYFENNETKEKFQISDIERKDI